MNQVWDDIRAGLEASTPLEVVNLALGVLGVVLMVRRSLWAFPVGMVAVSAQCVLFYRTRYYADATLQVFFFAVLAYGWWHWAKGRSDAAQLPVTTLAWPGRLLWLAGAAAGTVVWALWLRARTDAVMPFRDAFIAAFSVAGQALQARKHLESWPVWLLVNVVAVATYWAGRLYFTAVLFAIYGVLAVIGWRAWSRAMRAAA